MSNKRDMSKYYSMGEEQVCKRSSIDDENNQYFGGWSVHKKGDKYEFHYVAAAQGGGIIKFNITQDEYSQVRLGKLDFDDILERYPKYAVYNG